MRLLANKVLRLMKGHPIHRCYATEHQYNIPERYRNSFFLANASFFDDVNWYLHRAYEVCFTSLVNGLLEKENTLPGRKAASIVSGIIKSYDQCNSIIDVRFPIKRQNGIYELVRGFRAHHGLFSGHYPCLGGLRIHEGVTRDQMKGLAALNTYKYACMGISLCGAQGGIKICPKSYTDDERNQIVEQYATELYKKGFCGQAKLSYNTAAVGKPKDMHGWDNYDSSASQGAYFALDYFLNAKQFTDMLKITPGIKNKTFIIQGIGKVGSHLAEYLENAGAMCVGVKEHDGYIYEVTGIPIKELLAYKAKYGTITGFTGTKPVQGDQVYKEDCDILIFAACQKSLMCFFADKIKAKIILEAAHGPVPPIAHKILFSRGKLVIPDIYASSGASIASYLEYLVDLKQSGINVLRYTKEIYSNILDVLSSSKVHCIVSTNTTQKMTECSMHTDTLTYGIESVMVETANEIVNVAKEYNLGMDIRTAAYIVAIKNIFRSIYHLKKY